MVLLASTIAGTPRGDIRRLEDTANSVFINGNIFSKNTLLNEKFPLVEQVNTKSVSYSELYAISKDVYSKIPLPDYVTLESQMARGYVESSNNPDAISPVGARGVYQIMPDSWNDIMPGFSFNAAFDPYLNTMASARHINIVDAFLKKNYPGFEDLSSDKKLDLMNASYNGGHGRLQSVGWDINKMPAETKLYVKKIRDRIDFEKGRLRLLGHYENNFINEDASINPEIPAYNR